MDNADGSLCPLFLRCSAMLSVSLPLSTGPALRPVLRCRVEGTSEGWLSAPTVAQRHPLDTGKHNCTRTNPVLLESVQLDPPPLPWKPATACSSGANAQCRNCSPLLAVKQPRPQEKACRFLAM